MALEYTELNPGVGGDRIANDVISGVKVPVSKLLLGADGVNGGMVDAANPLPVSMEGGITVTGPMPVTDNGGSLTVDGTVTANAGTGFNFSGLAQESGGNLETLAGWDNAGAAQVGGFLATPSATFNRPGDTTQYSAGDLIANSAAAGSVAPMSWTAARVAAGSGMVRRARLRKTTTGSAAASFRLHLYGASPTAANGDNGAWLTTRSGYLGSIDLDFTGANGRIFSDGLQVIGVPAVGSEISFALASGQLVYGLLEARDAYAPGNAESFSVELELILN